MNENFLSRFFIIKFQKIKLQENFITFKKYKQTYIFFKLTMHDVDALRIHFEKIFFQ